MNIIHYNKLVRDRIPEIIQASGKTCVTEILSDADYLKMVDAKLDEELAEYHKDQTIEELADLMEVIYAAAKARGYTLEQLEAVRAEKAAKRGSFERKLLLKQVIEPSEAIGIAKTICQMQSGIMNRLDIKMFGTYFWLQNSLQKRNISTDLEYQRKFAGYYRMRFVSPKYRSRFFEVFEAAKLQTAPSFRAVSEALFYVDGKHEFSFITKMLHTIDPHRPIYDSQVDAALGIHRTYQSDFETKLRRDEEILSHLSALYQELAALPDMAEPLAAFDRIFSTQKMSAEKKLDFIFQNIGSKPPPLGGNCF